MELTLTNDFAERLSDDGDEVKGCTSLPPPLPSEDLDFGSDEDWDLEVLDIIVGHEFRCIKLYSLYI